MYTDLLSEASERILSRGRIIRIASPLPIILLSSHTDKSQFLQVRKDSRLFGLPMATRTGAISHLTVRAFSRDGTEKGFILWLRKIIDKGIVSMGHVLGKCADVVSPESNLSKYLVKVQPMKSADARIPRTLIGQIRQDRNPVNVSGPHQLPLAPSDLGS